MANDNRPRGLWPIRHNSGGQIRTSRYKVDASDSTLLTKGDPVKPEADGYCTRAAANGEILGVIASIEYNDANGKKQWVDQIAATKTGFTNIWLNVYSDPDIVFGIQADGNTTEVDRFAALPIVIADGDTTTNTSNCELDTTGGTGDELRIIDKVNKPGNDWGTNVDLEVIINDHTLRAVKAGT